MEIKFLKDWENYPGHTIKAGKIGDVARRIANDLIIKGIAEIVTATPLPKEIPGYKQLIAANINTYEQLSEVENYEDIHEIGAITAERIERFLHP